MSTTVTGTWLSKRRLESLLDALDAVPPLEALTLSLTPGASLDSVHLAEVQHIQWLNEIRSIASDRLAASETGAVVFWSDSLQLLVIPPFPLDHGSQSTGVDTSPLRALMQKKFTLGVVLLRLGRYSVGVFKGDVLLTSKTDTRYVKGRHSAGGTSQRRFARIRQKQIYELFVKACSVTEEKLGPFEKEMDHIFLGGERHTLTDFLKECPFLRRMESRIAKRILLVGEPRRRELENMSREIWKSRATPFKLPERFPFEGLG
jgi:hypothetical protein